MNDPHNLHRRILLACSIGDARLFRNNVGLAWQGDADRRHGGTVVIHNARPLHAGLCVGSSDLIGWRSVVVTPEMIGKRVAVFAAIEAKTGRGRATEAQAAFIAAVIAAGGIAGVARSADEAAALLQMSRRDGLR